jgi:hypothetical protein
MLMQSQDATEVPTMVGKEKKDELAILLKEYK